MALTPLRQAFDEIIADAKQTAEGFIAEVTDPDDIALVERTILRLSTLHVDAITGTEPSDAAKAEVASAVNTLALIGTRHGFNGMVEARALVRRIVERAMQIGAGLLHAALVAA